MKKIALIALIIIFGFLCFFLGNNIDKNLPDNYFVKEGLAFYMPDGWSYDESLGVPTIINLEEQREEDDTFRSYIVFLEEDANNRSAEQIYDYFESNVKSSLPDATFEEVDEQGVHIIKASATNEEKEYQINSAFIPGSQDNYWIISLNTDMLGLEDADTSFKKVVDSFKLR